MTGMAIMAGVARDKKHPELVKRHKYYPARWDIAGYALEAEKMVACVLDIPGVARFEMVAT